MGFRPSAVDVKTEGLRIAIFAPHFAEYAVRLGLALSRHGAVLLVVDRANFAAECSEWLQTRARGRLEILAFESVGRANRVRSLLAIIQRVLIFSPSVINVQEQIDNLSTWVVRALRPIAPIALTVHDPRPHPGLDTEWVKKNASNRAHMRAAASLFHVHGQFCAGQLREQIGADRPFVETPHGAILAPERDEIRPAENGRLLMFGRMEAYKGLGVLLDAAEALRRRGLRFQIAIVGRGSELELNRARLASDDIDLVEAFVTPGAAVGAFQRASVVVLPYVEATQSGVAAAAFANSRAVVASHCGGLVDAIEDGVDGILMPPGDAAALADALGALLANPAELARLTQGARIAGETRFAWEPIGETLASSFRRLAAGRRRPWQ